MMANAILDPSGTYRYWLFRLAVSELGQKLATCLLLHAEPKHSRCYL